MSKRKVVFVKTLLDAIIWDGGKKKEVMYVWGLDLKLNNINYYLSLLLISVLIFIIVIIIELLNHF